MKNSLENKPSLWNSLLSSDESLKYQSRIVNERINTAYVWGRSESKILNIGSGQGFLEEKFGEQLHTIEWVSLDISSIGLRRLKDKYHIKTICTSILSLNQTKKIGKFNCIYMLEVYEHLDKQVSTKALSIVKELLELEGKLIISVPVYEPRSLVKHPVGHKRKFTPEFIEAELRKNGFTIVRKKCFYAFNRMYALKSNIALWLKFRTPSVVAYLCKKE